MFVRIRRDLRSRSGRLLLFPVLAVLVLVAVGGGYEQLSEATEQSYAMPGRLIDVGGHQLHLSCTGSGSPTVVLEPGAGQMSLDLAWITPAVARETRVCVYDRAGRGWSEDADADQDATQIATDLHTLLQRGRVPGPYVLAGHSFGGLYVLTFASRYPDDVAGLVLVDSTAPTSPEPGGTSRPEPDSYDLMGRASALVSTSARFGLGRLIGLTSYDTMPPQVQDELRALTASESQLRSTIDEYLQGNSSMAQAASLTDFANKPMVVLTAADGHDASWRAAQDRLAALSTNSEHVVVDGATHPEMLADEDAAAATTQAIHDVVSSIRDAQPLDR
jgi:pimeloyl-ACP methyl ester carboxylesterase